MTTSGAELSSPACDFGFPNRSCSIPVALTQHAYPRKTLIALQSVETGDTRPQHRPSNADHSKGARQPLLSLKYRTADSDIASEIRMTRTQHTV